MFPAGRDPVFAGSHVQIAMKQNRHPALIANAGNLRDFSKLIRGISQKAAGVGNAQALEPVAERVPCLRAEQMQEAGDAQSARFRRPLCRQRLAAAFPHKMHRTKNPPVRGHQLSQQRSFRSGQPFGIEEMVHPHLQVLPEALQTSVRERGELKGQKTTPPRKRTGEQNPFQLSGNRHCHRQSLHSRMTLGNPETASRSQLPERFVMMKADAQIQFPVGISFHHPAVRVAMLALFRKNVHQQIAVGEMPDKAAVEKCAEAFEFLGKDP